MRKSSSKKYGDKQYYIFKKAKGFKGEFFGYICKYCNEEIHKNKMPHRYKSVDSRTTLAVIKSITDDRYLLCANSYFMGDVAVKIYENKKELHGFLRDCLKTATSSSEWFENIVRGMGGKFVEIREYVEHDNLNEYRN